MNLAISTMASNDGTSYWIQMKFYCDERRQILAVAESDEDSSGSDAEAARSFDAIDFDIEGNLVENANADTGTGNIVSATVSTPQPGPSEHYQ
uniref:Uncharacterized protein n=1 Tax=Sarcoptes scabiei TaxID=52283 RepID=A0A834RE85_SARSC